MEIKTISYRLDNTNDFDIKVNEALAEGWVLERRYISCPHTNTYRALIAEMTKGASESLKVKIKYFGSDLEPLEKIAVGDWIDLRASMDVILRTGEYGLIPLGVGMILPDGYEAHVLPRSSTPSKFGIMLANSMGVIDNSYSGDADEWHFPALAIRDTVIHKGDRIAQFRIVKNQPSIEFEVVEHLNEVSRGGIGSTGVS